MSNPQTVRLGNHAIYLDDDGKDIAENVTYDPTASGLTATNVQDAIDELSTGGSALNWEPMVDGTGLVMLDGVGNIMRHLVAY